MTEVRISFTRLTDIEVHKGIRLITSIRMTEAEIEQLKELLCADILKTVNRFSKAFTT